jgi:hypothetical protein
MGAVLSLATFIVHIVNLCTACETLSLVPPSVTMSKRHQEANKNMKKQLKKQAASVIIASMVLSGGAVYADSGVQAVVTSAQVTSAQTTASPYNVVANDQVIATAAFANKDKQIMVPLRETAEALGFKVTWHQDKQWAEVSLTDSPIWTLVQPELDQYAYNRMNVKLGAAPIQLAGRLYVPASFFNEILRSNISYEGNQVTITRQVEGVNMHKQQAVITHINNDKSLQINGAGMDGIIINIDEETVIRNRAGEQVELGELTLGLNIEVKHSMAMTMSLPGQTYAYEITALEETDKTDMLGTSGSITEVRQDDAGNKSIVVQGMGMSEYSQEHVILTINPDTIIIDLQGNPVDQAQLTKDAMVLSYYGPALTRSLPPMGQAWKIVYLGN